ncbi:MAG: hypothetical protein FRX49_13709 [Trebouxia sp. A1-2]|nr:MAG: hypothetical protein FRX49_13709 [Trebouxia sp. A1-2]
MTNLLDEAVMLTSSSTGGAHCFFISTRCLRNVHWQPCRLCHWTELGGRCQEAPGPGLLRHTPSSHTVMMTKAAPASDGQVH